jgi:transcriptional regulator with XRE-family HTH domain
MPKKSKALAYNLRRAREARGFSYAKMADFLELNSPQTLQNYEDGRVPRDMETLEKIATKLGTDINGLLMEVTQAEPGMVLADGPTTELYQTGLPPKPRKIEDRLETMEQQLADVLSELRKMNK